MPLPLTSKLCIFTVQKSKSNSLPTARYNELLFAELMARQSKGLIPKDTLLLVIDDPVKGIGSGGATLNALLVISENLASQAGYTVMDMLCYM